ncbi:hypothetical protein PUR21_23155 [Methylorubrum rhodesianum]|uniref:Uncharacterized protein n=1 Tax=Methylorubrum rhodesianum TaxID=29427 RepID=A0ABU9ZH57_9HYPH
MALEDERDSHPFVVWQTVDRSKKLVPETFFFLLGALRLEKLPELLGKAREGLPLLVMHVLDVILHGGEASGRAQHVDAQGSERARETHLEVIETVARLVAVLHQEIHEPIDHLLPQLLGVVEGARPNGPLQRSGDPVEEDLEQLREAVVGVVEAGRPDEVEQALGLDEARRSPIVDAGLAEDSFEIEPCGTVYGGVDGDRPDI